MIPGLKRFSLLLILVAACWSVCLSQGKILVPPADLSDWKEFASPEGRFSVLLPGTPVTKVTELQTKAGKVSNYVFTLELKEAFYHISYLDYPVAPEDEELVKRSLDASRDGMLARNKGSKLLGESQITFGSFLGREFLILQDRFSFGIIRTFIIRGRLFEVGMLVRADVAFTNGRATARAEDRSEQFNLVANRFFDSFEPADAMNTLGEVDRMARELSRKHQGVVTMVGSAGPAARHPITGGVINGKAVHLVTPPYPPIARSTHAAGQVSVKVIIDLDGNVAAAQALDGHPLLRAAAVKAARESKFTPTQLEGKPVMVMGVIIYNFVPQ